MVDRDKPVLYSVHDQHRNGDLSHIKAEGPQEDEVVVDVLGWVDIVELGGGGGAVVQDALKSRMAVGVSATEETPAASRNATPTAAVPCPSPAPKR